MKKVIRIRYKMLALAVAMLLCLCMLPMQAFAEDVFTDEYGHEAEWWNFRNTADNNAVTDRPTPTSDTEAWEKWAVKYGTGYNAAPTPPVIVDGKIYVAVNQKILELDKETGAILRESEEMPGGAGYAMQSPVYADGKIFVAITNGRICAVNIDDLKVAWVSDNSSIIRGQTVSPLTYIKNDGTGYISTGTWTTGGGDLFCVTTDDSNLTYNEAQDIHVKALEWSFNPDTDDADNLEANNSVAKGYYWTGGYATEKYLAIGSDNGSYMGDEASDTAFYTLNPKSGEIIDAVYGIHGQVRSTAVYRDGYLYFSTKGAKVYKIPVDENGDLGEPSFIDLSAYGATSTTATPVVYGGKIYLGVAGSGNQFSADGGHGFMTIRDDETLSQSSFIYNIKIPGYPQAGALLSTYHEAEDFNGDGKADGRVYLFFTYNASPGGIYYTYDTPDQTKPTELSNEEAKIFVPTGNKQQYCISSIVADKDGTLYYKNDSCYLFAVESNPAALLNLTVYNGAGEEILPDKEFQSKIADYNLKVDETEEKVLVKLELGEGVTATVQGEAYSDDGVEVPLTEEETVISIQTSKNGKERAYTLTVKKTSSVADLEALASAIANTSPSISKKYRLLLPEFDKDVCEYTVDWITTGTGDSEDPESTPRMNLFLKPESDFATVAVWPVENVDSSRIASDGTITGVKVTGNTPYTLRYPVYSADITHDSKVRIVVTAEDGVTTKEYLVTFNRRILAADVQLSESAVQLQEGETLQLEAVVTPDNATDKTVTWTSSDPAIASVDETGLVTAGITGEAVITAASEDGPYAECTVTVEGHTPIFEAAREPSCEAIGLNRDCWHCPHCGRYYTDAEGTEEIAKEEVEISATGHLHLQEKEAVPATLEAEGNIAYWICEDCGKLFKDADGTEEIESEQETVIPKLIDISKAEVSKITDQTYTGKQIKPAAKVTLDGTALISGTDYSVSYKNNKAVGKATVTITGKGLYGGAKSITFSILPKPTTISKVTAAKKAFTVKWKKQAKETTGYQIQYSTNKNFKSGNKTVLVKKAKTVSKKISKLKSKKTYYVRIRTYKTVSGKKYYSVWSTKKRVKVK